jgi:hypothetical protein
LEKISGWGKLDFHDTPIASITGTFYLDYRENGSVSAAR